MRKIASLLLVAHLLPLICFAEKIKPFSGLVSVSGFANDNIDPFVKSQIWAQRHKEHKESRTYNYLIIKNIRSLHSIGRVF